MEDPGDGQTFLLQDGVDFQIESGPDGSGAPTAPPMAPNQFLLANADLSNVDVLHARAEAIVAPSREYFGEAILRKRS